MKRATDFIKKADTAKVWMAAYTLLAVFLLVQAAREEDGSVRMWMTCNVLWIAVVIIHIWNGEAYEKIISLQNEIIDEETSYIDFLRRKIKELTQIKMQP